MKPSTRTLAIAVLASLLGLHLLVSTLWVAPGHLSIDEGMYHMMAKSFADLGSLEIWNGYDEFPSEELELRTSRARGGQVLAAQGRLVAVAPYLYPVLSSPFYAGLGYRGLFLLNALAFVAVILLCYRIALETFGSRSVGFWSALFLGVATFAWQYSQAAWPHMAALLFVTAAFYLYVGPFRAPPTVGALARLFASGVVAGLAVGIRLDCILALAAMAAPLALSSPPQLRKLVVWGAGALPGLALLTWTNHVKFGVLSPLTVGEAAGASVSRYLPLVLAGSAIAAIVWLGTRGRSLEFLARNRIVAVLAAALLALVAFGVPPLRDSIDRVATGVHVLAVDLRALEQGERREPGQRRTGDGAVLYIGALKKALLQSCPYLAALLLLPFRLRSGTPRAGASPERALPPAVAFGLLLTIPTAYLLFYGYSSWHGGLCLNMRYLLPVLPFSSILAAWVFVELTGALDRASTVALPLCAILASALYFALLHSPESISIERLELVYARLPLHMASLLGLLVLGYAGLGRSRRGLATAAAAMMSVCLVWSSLVAFHYDYAKTRNHRSRNLAFGRHFSRVVEDDSLAFVYSSDHSFALLEKPGVRLARPDLDRFSDFPELARFHLARERPVYLIMPGNQWRRIEQRGLLDGFRARVALELPGYLVGRLEPAP